MLNDDKKRAMKWPVQGEDSRESAGQGIAVAQTLNP